MATSARHRKLRVEEFLEIDFGPDRRFELEDGVIYAMAGGSPSHARVQANILAYLHARLRGTGCRAYGPDMAMKTMAHTLRYPDVTVYCGSPGQQEAPDVDLLSDPKVVVEVLSPSTRSLDEGRKLEEYQSLSTVDVVALVDPIAETTRAFRRNERGEWDDFLTRETGDVPIPSLGITIPKDEIFARD